MKHKEFWNLFIKTCRDKGYEVTELSCNYFCPVEYEWRPISQMHSFVAKIGNVFVHADDAGPYEEFLGCFVIGELQETNEIEKIWEELYNEQHK